MRTGHIDLGALSFKKRRNGFCHIKGHITLIGAMSGSRPAINNFTGIIHDRMTRIKHQNLSLKGFLERGRRQTLQTTARQDGDHDK